MSNITFSIKSLNRNSSHSLHNKLNKLIQFKDISKKGNICIFLLINNV